ncbi:hypothetical protein M3Y98_00469900 [Aphelenchoides besseyi]|nr:hypothetical protein M3Y98_00469900 [Aphelenchoides besseyi]KAI6207557.1 hypothetical protein M3Y96_00021700 [Aphelenchoides besseyi]
MPPKQRIPKPYVNSSLQLNVKDFPEIPNLNSLLKFLELQNIKRPKWQPKDTKVDDQNQIVGDKPERLVVIGLKQVLRFLKQKKLGAIILDNEVAKPSAVGHVFALLSISQKDCQFFRAFNLSDKASALLNLPKVSAIGILKKADFLESLLPEKNSKSTVKFKKPTFKVPIGKAAKQKRVKTKKKQQPWGQ